MKKAVKWVFIILLLGIICYPAFESLATVRLIGRSLLQHRLGLSTDTKPTLSAVQIGATFKETDTGNMYMWDSSAWNAVMATSTSTEDQITVSATSSTARATAGFNEATYNFLIHGASINVSFTLQGKVLGGGWMNLDATNDSTTLTAADTIGITYTECASIDSIRAWAFNISASDSLYVWSKLSKTQSTGE